MTLSFFVEKQKITRTDTETPAANSNCYLKAKFEFGSDWDVSSSICPIFRRGGEDSGYMPKLTNGSFLDEQNICFVPIEVLNKEGRFFVSIFDYKNGKTITTNEAMVEVCRSGPVFNSPTIYGLDLRFENENLQLTANGEAVGEGVEIPKQKIDDAMSDTSENPVQNKVSKAYTDEKTKATPTDITLTDNLLQLTANGEVVGEGVEIPKQEIDDSMSDTSENPVQNKVAKAYTDEKTKATPTDITLTDNLLQLTANGEAVGVGVTLPKQEIDTEMSDTSENPVQNKVAKAYTDEKTKATPTDIALKNNLLQLTANGSPVGDGVKIKEQWELIDEMIIETNELPVVSWFIDLIGRGYKRLWITGEFYSSDTTTATQTISIGGGSASGKYGGTYVQISGTNFSGGRKYYLSAFLTVMPNNNIIGEMSIGTNAASNVNGGYIKNCGNFVGSKFTEIPRPMIKFGSASQQFAGGTNLQMWGCKQ